MTSTIKLVPFADGHIPTVTENNQIHIILPTVCTTMGLDWESQRQRIERHPILAETTCIIQVVSATGPKPTTVTTLEGFHAFLVTLHPDRIDDPVLRELVITYQRHAFRAVFEFFHGKMRAGSTNVPRVWSVAEFGRTTDQLKKERNRHARLALFNHLD